MCCATMRGAGDNAMAGFGVIHQRPWRAAWRGAVKHAAQPGVHRFTAHRFGKQATQRRSS